MVNKYTDLLNEEQMERSEYFTVNFLLMEERSQTTLLIYYIHYTNHDTDRKLFTIDNSRNSHLNN